MSTCQWGHMSSWTMPIKCPAFSSQPASIISSVWRNLCCNRWLLLMYYSETVVGCWGVTNQEWGEVVRVELGGGWWNQSLQTCVAKTHWRMVNQWECSAPRAAIHAYLLLPCQITTFTPKFITWLLLSTFILGQDLPQKQGCVCVCAPFHFSNHQNVTSRSPSIKKNLYLFGACVIKLLLCVCVLLLRKLCIALFTRMPRTSFRLCGIWENTIRPHAAFPQLRNYGMAKIFPCFWLQLLHPF